MSSNIVYMVDDDFEVLKAVEFLLKTVNLQMKPYQDPKAFLGDLDTLAQGCVLLDVRMPNLSGMELLKIMQQRMLPLPIIVVTAYGDVPMAVQAIKNGAIDFISKPFNEQALLETIQRTLVTTHQNLHPPVNLEETAKHYLSLTQREQQVLSLVVEGELNKQIAAELGIAVSTVEMHRGNIMRKMQVSNIAQLIKKAMTLKI